MAGKSVLWLRSIPSTKPDIRRSRPPIQKRIITSLRLFTPIASFRCAAEFDRDRGIADFGKPSVRQIYGFRYTDGKSAIHVIAETSMLRPIIGWLVRQDGRRVKPITVEPEPIDGDEAWAIVTPNGMFVEPGVGSWKSAQDCHVEVLTRWKQRKTAVAA
jgi:hypothetical protein